MLGKLAYLTLALVALGVSLLVLRHQRLEIANENAALFGLMQTAHQQVWASQSRCAQLLEPKSLHKRIAQAHLALEPYDPYKPDRATRQGIARASSR